MDWTVQDPYEEMTYRSRRLRYYQWGLLGTTRPEKPDMMEPMRAPRTICVRPLVAVGGLIALLTMWQPMTATARNQSSPAHSHAASPRSGELLELTVCGSSATFNLDVSTKTPTVIELPSGMVSHLFDGDTPYAIREDGDRLYVAAPANTEPGHEFALRVRGTRKDGDVEREFEASLHTKAKKSLTGIKDSVVIYHQSDKERFGDRPEDNPCSLQHDEGDLHELRVRSRIRQLGKKRSLTVPEIAHIARSGDGLDVNLSFFEWSGNSLAVHFHAKNHGFPPVTLDRVQAFDADDKAIGSELLYWHADGTAAHNQPVAVAGDAHVTASILLPDASKRNTAPITLEFHGFKNGAPFTTAVKVYRAVPVTEDDDAREARAKQLTVSARGLYGGFWLDDAAGNELLDLTNLSGVGLLIQKGHRNGFAIEGEIVGARSGIAHFSRVSWGGVEGDISRRAYVGRVLGGVAMRYGHEYVFTGRLGLGFQVTSNDSTFTVDGAPMSGPGDDVGIDMLASVGAGFGARIGDNLSLGVNMAFARTFDTGSRSLEVGAYFGYGWNP